MVKDTRQSAAPVEMVDTATASSWDTEAFAQRVKTSKDVRWKSKQQSKKTTRVQDISMNLESGHGEHERKAEEERKEKEGKEESWPFESSPCQMFGGKNTKKKGGNDAVNKELFKTEFDIKKVSNRKTDSEVSKEVNESDISDSDNNNNDDDDNDDEDDEDEDDDDDDGHSFGEESEDFQVAKETKETKVPPSSGTERAPQKTTTQGKERSLLKAASYRSLDSTGNPRSQDKPIARRPLRRSDSDRNVTQKSTRDQLGGSCHPNMENKYGRRGGTATTTAKMSTQSLSAATTHGDKPSRTRTRTAAVQRARSSDGMETMRSSSHGLITSKTSHGDEGRLRSSRKLTKSSSSSKSGSRRGGLTRAMSTKNVKPPEQYSSSSSSSRPSSKDAERRKEGVEKEDPIPKKSSRPGLERKSSQRSVRKVSEKSSGSNSNKGKSRQKEESESEVEVTDPEVKRKPKSTKRGSTKEGKVTPVPEAAAPPPPRRDLLVLLREQKTVQPTDMMDKENRRLLHFLAFEHKMGISFKELRRSVSADV